MVTFTKPLKVAISYAHEDEGLKEELVQHLAGLYRQNIIRHWQDRDLKPGDEWSKVIDDNFEQADIILLLISPAFIDSSYCYEVEMARAIARHDSGACKVIPIFLRRCLWQGLPFAKLQGLPKDAIPVTSWPNRDEAFTNIAEGIRQTCVSLLEGIEYPPLRPKLVTPLIFTAPAPSVLETPEAIDDSGALVLLGKRFYESRSVTETDKGHFEVEITSSSAEEEADLRALYDGTRMSSRQVPYAHGNEGFFAQINSSKSQSTSGVRIWRVDLNSIEENRHHLLDVGINGLSAEEVATMRAQFLLLGERPPRLDRNIESLVMGWVEGRGEDKVQPVFPQAWKVRKKNWNFLREARLAAIYWLKKTSICQEILELRLGPLNGTELQIKFRGRRSGNWLPAPITINLQGKCRLE